MSPAPPATLRRRMAELLRPRTAPAALRSGVWRERPTPPACAAAPTMLVPDELRLLDFLADRYFREEGVIVDAGSFLGGSTLALASGLRANLARRRRPERRLIHAYDLFQIEDWTRGLYFPANAEAGASTRADFDRNVADFASLIDVHEGDITRSPPFDARIEILFVDVAKHWTVCDWITETLFPQLIPGRSIVVQQDYLYHHWNGWLQVTMEHYADHFDLVTDTYYNSVAFRLRRPFARGAIRPNLVASMPMSRRMALMDRAAARFTGEQAQWLRASKEHFIGMLREAGLDHD